MVLVVALALVACGGETADTTEPVTDAPATEHVHAYADEIIPATCSAAGKVISKCECGDVQSETELPLADHVASTLDCEKDTVCTVCNAVLAEKTGHVFGAPEVITAATCGAAGMEKGICQICGKTVETEIPATGHIPGDSITIADGKFKSTCTVCSQNVTLNAQTPALSLDFDDVAAEFAKSDLGLAPFNTEKWNVTNSALTINGDGQITYINIVDSTKLAGLGTFVISFDYMSTAVPVAGSPAASMISILNNHQTGKQTSAGSVGWGWMIKVVENGDKGYLATVNSASALTSANSIAIERNVKYNVQIVISPVNGSAHVFVNGTYIGASKNAIAISKISPENAAIRFGDGPNCGHTFDNLTISALK